MDHDEVRQREERWRAYDVYARLHQLWWRLPHGHPATPHLRRAAQEAEAYWRGLSTGAAAQPQADGWRERAAS